MSSVSIQGGKYYVSFTQLVAILTMVVAVFAAAVVWCLTVSYDALNRAQEVRLLVEKSAPDLYTATHSAKDWAKHEKVHDQLLAVYDRDVEKSLSIVEEKLMRYVETYRNPHLEKRDDEVYALVIGKINEINSSLSAQIERLSGVLKKVISGEIKVKSL